ncbi:Uncharacterized membrane protein YGL010W [Halopseudomonas xinjiangensis]|uniref:Uncharacterized membrane protein YGL010W n=1 Tax=Halopseudomonas xinjiangensis TaxID=487184 RepID=A0A1H1MGJ9_9GAMM|nr:Mpo1-like protein [Halopseudomonas xinjiangensis]SDR85893.1 Uncharacterized membrane protein YGL010W [Halopseudomonas xinjiangensis]
MKAIDQWFDEYGESHQNPLNKVAHWVCVPLITFSVLGMLWAIHPTVAIMAVVTSLVFYMALSWRIAAAMLGIAVLMLLILEAMPAVFWPSVIIFVLAWIGQFIGHHIEGKKPSFLKDMQFLLIGPIWLLGFVFRKIGLRY